MKKVAWDGGTRSIVDVDPAEIPTSAELLAKWRAQATCTNAQMRIHLHRTDQLATVQALAETDPEALIVWEYDQVLQRSSPLISVLNAATYTEAEIDAMFRAAAQI